MRLSAPRSSFVFQWFARWPTEQRAALFAVLLGSAVFLPYLGAVGLWDPWETHYGEVAREMVERGDFIHPHYENDWFFSKPALTMWMQAAGMLVAARGPAVPMISGLLLLGLGVFFIRRSSPLTQFWSVMALHGGVILLALGLWGSSLSLPWKFGDLVADAGALPVLFEWGFRLPSTSFCIVSLGLLAWALARVTNLRVALATVTVLTTMPLYFLISRQAVTDPPLVSATVCGVSCALIALFDAGTQRRSGWWYAAWAFFALATLAKGWLGFLVPAAVFAGYLVLFVTNWADLQASAAWVRRALGRSVGWSLLVGVIVGFAARYIALAQGTVFISGREVGGSDAWSNPPNWLGLTWGVLAMWAASTGLAHRLQLRFDPATTPRLVNQLQQMRLGPGVLLFLAVALPWYFEMFTYRAFDEENKHFWLRFIVHDHLSRFFSGVYTTTPGGSFTYFIEQGGYAIFPWVLLVPGAMGVICRIRLRTPKTTDMVAAIALLWLIIGWFAVGDSATKFHHYVFVLLPPLAILIGLFVDELWSDGIDAHLIALLAGAPLFVLVGKDLWTSPKHFTDLFVFNYDRPYPEFLISRPVLGLYSVKDLLELGSLGALALLGGCAVLRAKRSLFAVATAGALGFALWFSWSHWVDLSPQWTQRDQFWRYFSQRQPGEPIAAFMMNWRGETLYSRNRVEQIGSKQGSNAVPELQAYVSRPGRKWALVEHARLGVLINAIGSHPVKLIDKDLNNKFVLLTID